MGFLENMAAKLTDREKLILEATHVGSFDSVLRLGIESAKLGLVEDDLQKMARVYFLLRDTSMVADSDFVIERFLRAVREAQREGN